MSKSNIEPLRPRLLSMPDAAAYLGMGVWTLRRLCWNGKIPFVREKKGAHYQFDVADLDKWIETKKQKH